MFYSTRSGDYVYDVTVTVDDSAPGPRRFRARPSNIEHLSCRQLATVAAEIRDGYGRNRRRSVCSRRTSRRGVSNSPSNEARSWGSGDLPGVSQL